MVLRPVSSKTQAAMAITDWSKYGHGTSPGPTDPQCSTLPPSPGRGCTGGEGLDAMGGEEEEGKDHLPDNPGTSAIVRASNRSLSPFRRHSWESGRANVPGPPGDPADPVPAQRRSVHACI